MGCKPLEVRTPGRLFIIQSVGRIESNPLRGGLANKQASLSREGEAGLCILCKENPMKRWIPIFGMIGGGLGILALVLFIDSLKDKMKKQLRTNNRVTRDISSTDA